MNLRKSDRYILIMAGGRGERFWPVSREKTPKQLIRLLGEQSFLQQTVDRVLEVVPLKNILIITNQAQTTEVKKQLPDLPKENVIAEPCGRDTCAAIALGAALVAHRNPKSTMAVLPADHLIQDQKKFQRVMTDCFQMVSSCDVLVTIGIRPTEPATGYGYIRTGPELSTDFGRAKGRTAFWKVRQFVEKPNLSKAKRFLKSGEYRWNAGMFVWSVETFSKALKQHQPQMADACSKWTELAKRPAVLSRALKKDYPNIERISIDFALMEKAGHVVMADGAFDWDDLGSWTALERHMKSDSHQNCCRGELVQLDSSGNIIFDARRKQGSPIALIGIKDCIVVQTDDACMIAAKSHDQQIKQLVQLLARDDRFQGLK